MKVRPFEHSQLKDSDILADFIDTMNISDFPPLVRESQQQNITLSAAGIAVADKLAQIAPFHSLQRGPDSFLARIKGPAFIADMNFLKNVREDSEPALNSLEARYGLTFNENFEKLPQVNNCWSDEAVFSIAEILNGQSLRLQEQEDKLALLSARLAVFENKPKSAEQSFIKATARGRSFEAYCDFAQWLLDQQRYKEALGYADKAIGIEPKRPWPYVIKEQAEAKLKE